MLQKQFLSKRRTTYQQNTPSNNIPQEEVEIIDPAHPLFGRIFSVISIARQPNGETVMVRYQERMLLRIPIRATNLSFSNSYKIRTKLSLSSIEEFLEIAKECKALCHTDQNISGKESQQPYKNKFCKISLLSSRMKSA